MSYSNFINSMLELRNQHLKEELAQQAETNKMYSNIGSAIGGIGKTMSGAITQSKDDAMANQLMNSTIPRAQSADPALNATANKTAAGMPGFYTGGESQLDMGQKMGLFKQQQMSAAMQRLEYDKSRNLKRDASDALAKTDGKLQSDYNNEQAYTKSMAAFNNDLNNAKTPEQYKSISDSMTSLFKAASKRGMDVQPPTIVPFVSPEQKAAVAAQQSSVLQAQKDLSDAKSAPQGGWDRLRSGLGLNPNSSILGVPITFDSERAIGEAQKKFETEQETLKGMSTPTGQPISQTPTGTSGGFKVGDQRRDRTTGTTEEWDGTKWVPSK